MRYVERSVWKAGEGRWIVDIRDTVGSRRIRKTVRADDWEGARAEARLLVSRLNGERSVEEAIDAYIRGREGRVSSRTSIGYRSLARHMSPFAHVPVSGVDPAALRAHFDMMLGEGAGQSLVAKVRNLANAAFEQAVADGRAGGNPCAAVKIAHARPVGRREPDEGELDRLRLLLRSTEGAVPAALGLALECELSPGEICAMRPRDIGAGRVAVRGRVSRMGLGRCTLYSYPEPSCRPMPAWLEDALDPILASCGEYVFGTGDAPGNVDTLSRKANGLLGDFGFEFGFADIRKFAHSQERRA